MNCSKPVDAAWRIERLGSLGTLIVVGIGIVGVLIGIVGVQTIHNNPPWNFLYVLVAVNLTNLNHNVIG